MRMDRGSSISALVCAAVIAIPISLSAFTLPPNTTSHDCDLQADTTITFSFQVPLGVGNTRVTVTFGYNAGDSVSLAPTGVSVTGASQCPDCPCVLSAWYVSGNPTTQKDTDSGGDSGYYLQNS